MTCDEILAMQPGPELDAEIAVKLFGWSGVLEVRPGEFLRTGVGHLEELPNYSASWGYMRLMVEAMAARGWRLKLHTFADTVDAEFYLPALLNADGWLELNSTHARATAETAPHAVAIAARLALEEER